MGAILEKQAPAEPAACIPWHAMTHRTVFYVSDGTGITAETFGNAILAQFEVTPRHIRLPFTDTPDKAHQVVRQINHVHEVEGVRPIVFTTLVDPQMLAILREGCKGMLLDMFGTFVQPIEAELGIKSLHRVGRFSDISRNQAYHDRIEAINFSLQHDDGQSHRDLAGADVILVGVLPLRDTPIRITSAPDRSRWLWPSSWSRLKLMASMRSLYSLDMLMSEKRPTRWCDLVPSSASSGRMKVPNMSSSMPLQPSSMILSTLMFTSVVNTMGFLPSSSAVWLIWRTTWWALSSVSVKGRRTWRGRRSNCARMALPKVSAVMPVPSET